MPVVYKQLLFIVMSGKNYLDFTPEEFASDTYFQNWVLKDDHMTNLFWEKWLKDNPKKQADIDLARKLIQQFTFKEYQASEEDFNEVWKNLKENQSTFATKKSFKKRWYAITAAASVALLISVSVLFNKKDPKINLPIIVNNNIKAGTDKAILTLEDGKDIALEKGQNYTTDNIVSNGEEITYKFRKRNKAKILYNYLTTLAGGQFHITLSDGTKVWLNSESQLKYPVTFIEGETRRVELVYGEAYFDVSSSTEHKGSKFKVLNQAQEVEVLGTEFNIKAYKDENNIYTTLVEGKVAVNFENTQQVLFPNQQLNMNFKDNSTKVLSVDVYREISWKDGVFSFKNKALKDIMKVLSRWYEIEVIFENQELEDVTFNGALEKKLDITDILSIIDVDYEINNKTVTLK
ncbi:FecR family protein [Flavivirga spongiicola]|uniref:FecR family protein n=1 Tax=Flavivirga spongiicola TaxID=421621 RepID=A0ABU7XYS7_9FLAO|nr:FecR family protein [Flavivirga sp. MEBiC05379]MDO5980937.1 FecR family protein [Flavivirga sp. MEBiC05379]